MAPGIGGREEDEAADAFGIAGGEHERDCSAVRMGDDVGVAEAEGIHGSGEAVGGGFEAGVEAGDALGLAHSQLVDGVDAGGLGERADAVAPVRGRSDQTVDKQHRLAGAGVQIIHARALDGDGGALNWWEGLVHRDRFPLSVQEFNVTTA